MEGRVTIGPLLPRGLAFAEGEIFRAQGCSAQAGWLALTRLYW